MGLNLVFVITLSHMVKQTFVTTN